ncbi:helix-turn-helix transcriptional regulator [Bradyrhizobium tropiciagri]|uniref:ArsR/SmtB family transcription factor n=1 Tax=Bradyrhizobium tropiciagri TaxID=312253 RepID=UPI001BA79AA9|nr:metalloregulator ArsR/SmtB family transcription factor [Bradyrhizobium tropiciagri]MBR0870646.1 helix-turn-helix transcriptional regulator [Bradyrhizobium tropiciagri]
MESARSVQTGFSRIAEALGDPAREAMVSALADGKALPAGELASVAGISPQSASAHLQKLVDARVLSVWAQGRFRYYRIRDDDVAALIETLVDLAAKSTANRKRALPAEQLRQSRTCYHHLAGQLGVLLSNALIRRRFVAIDGRSGQVTGQGLAWCRAEAIDFDAARQPHCRLCNDWTERVPHLAGPFANAVLARLLATRCVAPHRIPRALRITDKGRAFFDRLGVQVPF